MKNHLTKISSTHPGFTLLEMLFAVIIFSFALVSLMTIAGRGVIASSSAKDQLTAQFLAEEALEVARNTRDTNYIYMTDWLSGLEQCQNTPCDVDYSGSTPILTACDSGDCQGEYLYNNKGDFDPVDNGGAPTSFWRELVITPIHDDALGQPDQVRVDATVHWRQKSLERKMTVTTYMTNWQF